MLFWWQLICRDRTDKEGGSGNPLIVVCQYGHLEIAKLLIGHGANVNFKNEVRARVFICLTEFRMVLLHSCGLVTKAISTLSLYCLHMELMWIWRGRFERNMIKFPSQPYLGSRNCSHSGRWYHLAQAVVGTIRDGDWDSLSLSSSCIWCAYAEIRNKAKKRNSHTTLEIWCECGKYQSRYDEKYLQAFWWWFCRSSSSQELDIEKGMVIVSFKIKLFLSIPLSISMWRLIIHGQGDSKPVWGLWLSCGETCEHRWDDPHCLWLSLDTIMILAEDEVMSEDVIDTVS